MVVIEGYIRDSTGQPLVGIPVEAFQQNPMGDLTLTGFPQPTDNEGYFNIASQRKIDENNSNVYIVVTDEAKKFVSVRDNIVDTKEKNSFL